MDIRKRADALTALNAYESLVDLENMGYKGATRLMTQLYDDWADIWDEIRPLVNRG